MNKTKDEGGAGLQNVWITGQAAIAASMNRAGTDGYADRLRATSAFNRDAGQPFMFVPSMTGKK